MATHLLSSPARCLCAQAGNEDEHAFLVGTASLRGKNEVRLLKYFDGDIEVAVSCPHEGEVTGLSSASFDAAVLLTVSHNAAGRPMARIWRLPESPATSAAGGADALPTGSLSLVAELPAAAASTRILHAQFFPTSDGSHSHDILAVDDTTFRVHTLRPDGTVATASAAVETGDAFHIGGAAWDSLHVKEVAIATDSNVACWDVSSGERIRAIANAVPAGSCVRSVSYNANKPYMLATAGDDHRVKVWDVRRATTPVKVLDGHTHWVTSVAFNNVHDQLVLSGGTDGRVNLWRLSSISSAPLLELGEDDGAVAGAGAGATAGAAGETKKPEAKMAPDICVRSHEDHDDSVYSVVWSVGSAWVYASLSYPGKVVVAEVPSAEKYKILL